MRWTVRWSWQIIICTAGGNGMIVNSLWASEAGNSLFISEHPLLVDDYWSDQLFTVDFTVWIHLCILFQHFFFLLIYCTISLKFKTLTIQTYISNMGPLQKAPYYWVGYKQATVCTQPEKSLKYGICSNSCIYNNWAQKYIICQHTCAFHSHMHVQRTYNTHTVYSVVLFINKWYQQNDKLQ